jgi:hypothetical protein
LFFFDGLFTINFFCLKNLALRKIWRGLKKVEMLVKVREKMRIELGVFGEG